MLIMFAMDKNAVPFKVVKQKYFKRLQFLWFAISIFLIDEIEFFEEFVYKPIHDKAVKG